MKQAIFLLVILINLSFSQEIGKIFRNEEVPAIFGEKISEVKLEAEIIRNAIQKTGDYILFKIHNDGIIITDKFQNIIHAEKDVEYVDPEWVFKLFSVSAVEKLLDTVNFIPEKFVYFETREKGIVLRYEDKSLDRSKPCPPNCGVFIVAK